VELAHPTVLQCGERDRGCRAHGGEDPERAARALLGAQNRHDSRRRGQQADDDGRVTGGHRRQGERRQQRESCDDSRGDDRETGPLHRGGRSLSSEGEGDHGERGGDHGAARPDEQRRQPVDGDTRERKRE
jgi:hypothetical protein